MPKIEEPTCLIVDDEPLILSLVKEFLQSIGYTCATALSAEQALELLSGNSFSLMMTDLQLGGMDGLTLTKLTKKTHPSMPIIVMTGYTEDHSFDEAIAAGAADFLKKPFTMNEVRTRVGLVMRESQLMDLLKQRGKETEEISTMMIAGLQEEAQQRFVVLEEEIARMKAELLSCKLP
jgi:DNA-binding response OmpR family regulator